MSRKNMHATSTILSGLSFIVVSVFLALSLFTFHDGEHTLNLFGLLGYSLSWIFIYLFGLGSYLWVFYGIHQGTKLLFQRKEHNKFAFVFFFIFLCCCCINLTQLTETSLFKEHYLSNFLYTSKLTYYEKEPFVIVNKDFLGGVPFFYLYSNYPLISLKYLLGPIGTVLINNTLLCFSFILWTNLPTKKISLFSLKIISNLASLIKQTIVKTVLFIPRFFYIFLKRFKKPKLVTSPKITTATYPVQETLKKSSKKTKPYLPTPPPETSSKVSPYHLPSNELLSEKKIKDYGNIKKEIYQQAKILEETLLSFGIEGKVGEVHNGPRINSFEVHPPTGVKVQKIKVLEKDIALNLKASSIRIIAPIPGKAAVGIEVPNQNPEDVSFKELLHKYQKGSKKHTLPFLLGKAVNGDVVALDLVKLPHCIIAGATGSGKSVCINTLIMSILMNHPPEEVKFIMIDPKKVELTPYNSIPHMISPVITEPFEACAALAWLVKKMEDRYDILKQLGFRNIQAFNQRTPDASIESSLGLTIPEKFPYLLCIIDELADLMMVSSSEIETPIARIAQMARAVGIHMILSTQRPSREVITGLIKANFPSRIAFKVSSRVNSQIILDEPGAEALLGNGDMLFLAPGSSSPIRAQGALIKDEDINLIVKDICQSSPPEYLIPSFSKIANEISKHDVGRFSKQDHIFEEAKQIVLSTGNASTTFLQRKLKIGYARAASLMDQLEENGIVGQQEGSKPRKIFYPNDN